MFLKILFLLLAYLIGSIPFGFLIGLSKGVDIRTVGSHNIGASNTGRVLGRKYAYITFTLDLLKGALFVALFRYGIIPSKYMVLDPSLYGFIAMIGHSFPIYLKFKGGKAVATGAGFIFAYIPILIPIGLLCFIITLKISNTASISSLVSTTLLLIISIVFTILKIDPITKLPISIYYIIFTICAFSLIFIMHIPNIKRLINKTELKA